MDISAYYTHFCSFEFPVNVSKSAVCLLRNFHRNIWKHSINIQYWALFEYSKKNDHLTEQVRLSSKFLWNNFSTSLRTFRYNRPCNFPFHCPCKIPSTLPLRNTTFQSFQTERKSLKPLFPPPPPPPRGVVFQLIVISTLSLSSLPRLRGKRTYTRPEKKQRKRGKKNRRTKRVKKRKKREREGGSRVCGKSD